MGLVIHNTCEDSLLASPIILDLVILTELCQRIKFRAGHQKDKDYQTFLPVLSILSYLQGSAGSERCSGYQLVEPPEIVYRKYFPCLSFPAAHQPHDAGTQTSSVCV